MASKETQESLRQFIEAQEQRVTEILSQLGWTKEYILENLSDVVQCPLDGNHWMPSSSLEKHLENCRLSKAGMDFGNYEQPVDTSFCYATSETVVQVQTDEAAWMKVREEAKRQEAEKEIHIPAAKSRREIDQSAVWVDPGPSLGSTNAAEEADLQEEEPPLLFNAELLGSRTIKLKPKSQDGNGDQSNSSTEDVSVNIPVPIEYDLVSKSVLERRIMYDQVIAASKPLAEKPVDGTDDPSLYRDYIKSEIRFLRFGTRDGKSLIERIAEKRDIKRRRQRYRSQNVHVNQKSIQEIYKSIIDRRMQEYEVEERIRRRRLLMHQKRHKSPSPRSNKRKRECNHEEEGQAEKNTSSVQDTSQSMDQETGTQVINDGNAEPEEKSKQYSKDGNDKASAKPEPGSKRSDSKDKKSSRSEKDEEARHRRRERYHRSHHERRHDHRRSRRHHRHSRDDRDASRKTSISGNQVSEKSLTQTEMPEKSLVQGETENPSVEMERSENPSVEMERSENPSVEMERSENPLVEMERSENPSVEMERSENPSVEMERSENPSVEMERSENPSVEMERSENPSVEMERSENPSVEMDPERSENPLVEMDPERSENPLVEMERSENPSVEMEMSVIPPQECDDSINIQKCTNFHD